MFELGLKGPAKVKGWDTRGESVASLVREEIHVGHDVCVLGVPGTPQEAGEANRDWQ